MTCSECGLYGFSCQCPDQDRCAEHGWQLVIEAGSSSGFTGAPIYWATLACGCQLMDASADDAEAAR